MSRKHWSTMIPALLIACGAAHAQETGDGVPHETSPGEQLGMSLRGGLSSSDNIRRESADEDSGTIASAGADLVYKHNSRRITADVDLDATYEDYSDDAFEDGIVGGIDAMVELGIVPERFTWFAQENFGQINSDPFAPNTPANREDVNFFTTGPDFTLQLGSANSLQLGGRYSDVNYEVSSADGTEVEGTLSLQHQLSSSSAVSINAGTSRYQFDDQVLNTDYDRSQAFLRYELAGSRTDITADLGYAQLDIDGEKSDGTLARLTVKRRISRAATLSLNVGEQFSTAGDLFREGQDAVGVGSQPENVIGLSDPFTSKQFGLTFEFARNRTSISLSGQYEREEYETQTAYDRDVTTWRLDFRRQLSAILEVSVFGLLEQQDFANIDFDDDELSGGAYLDWQVGRRLSTRFQYDRFDRESSDSLGDYTENRASIFLIWSPSVD